MTARTPDPIPSAESRRRRARALRLARSVGFVGRVEYRHVFSQTGGAQYGCGSGEAGDLLTVFAEAFVRDADPEDFSLLAIIAHERGHQLVARHPQLAGTTAAAEEVIASVLGAVVVGAGSDRDALLAKATAEVLAGGSGPDDAVRLIGNLWDALEGLP